MSDWALAFIVGTGAEFLPLEGGRRISVPTSAGTVKMIAFEIAGKPVLLASRHGAGHKVPPHKVQYAATALAFKQLRCARVIATAAVGSLRTEWPTGTLVVPDGLIDVSCRNITLFDDVVVHRDMSHPFSPALRVAILESAPPIAIHDGGTYINGNGPRYETPQEIEAMRRMGGDLVGMTAGTEAIVMREAGLEYGLICAVTNLAAGLTPNELGHGEVVDAMRQSMEKIADVGERVVARL